VDVGTAGGLHYLVWPLVEGTTLEGLIQEMAKLPSQLAALYGLQVAQGLAVAHQNNLFHGLVKPSNIMVGADNQARILDFGIGSLLVENEGESLVDTMSTANTLTSGLDCASPESIMEPTNRTPAGDQYSLGCVLYYCLTGRVPFPEGSAVEKMMAHQTRDPMPIPELAPDVPDGLVKVVARLMAKNPDDRFSGCDELVEALEPFLGDLAAIPGGVPQAAGSGRVPASTLRRSVPGGSGFGQAPKPPGLSAAAAGSVFGAKLPPGSNPGARTPVPAASHPGVKINPPPGSNPGAKPVPAGPPVFPTRPPAPAAGPVRSPSLPSRASFQLPQMSDEMPEALYDADEAPAEPAPAKKSRVRVPARQDSRWVDDSADRSGGGFGAVGLVAAAVLIMVAVYFGATMLLK
jgi:serine/threonine protein kinase